MIKYLIKVSYDGSKFYGFQRLNNLATIQKTIEDALKIIFKEEVLVKGAGRTDKGVHALDQAISFDAPFIVNCLDLKKAINRYVGPYIRVNKVLKKDKDFHARFSVKEKLYIYKINTGDYNPLLQDYMYQPKFNISIKKLREASKIFLGLHDFKNFVSGEHSNTISNISDIKISKLDDIITISIRGKAFYKYMVRNIVGAILDYNKGKITLDGLKKMLDYPDFRHQLTTSPPNGLYLAKIYY